MNGAGGHDDDGLFSPTALNSAMPDANACPGNRHLLALTILLLGSVFFFVVHDLQVSRYERFARWSDSDGGALEAGGNVAKGIALLTIGALGAYLLLLRNGRPARLSGWLPLMMFVYLAWALASVLWSADPGLSLRRLAVLMSCVVGAAGIARQFRPRDVALIAAAIATSYLLVGLAAEMALGTFRPWSSGYRFAGSIHPNSQGANLAVLSLAAFCLARNATQRRAAWWTLFAVAVAFLLLTRSRTACAALIAGLIAVQWAGASGRGKLSALLLAAFAIATAAWIGALLGSDADQRVLKMAMLGRAEESEAFTGRLPIWAELGNYVRKRPLQGYGYASFWTAEHIEAVSEELQWPLREAHNAYLDTVLSIGALGAAILLTVVALAFRAAIRAFRLSGDAGFAFTLGLLAFCLVDSCMESGMGDPNLTTLLAGAGIVQLVFLFSAAAASITQMSEMAMTRGRLCREP
jgi:O-antigen ligase